MRVERASDWLAAAGSSDSSSRSVSVQLETGRGRNRGLKSGDRTNEGRDLGDAAHALSKASRNHACGKRYSPYSIAERRVLELIPVLGSQPAGDVSHKPGGIGCHYFPPGLQLPSQPLTGLLPISLLGDQRHDGCTQFA